MSAAAYLNGQYHMVLTRVPSSTNVTELWHAVSLDGRTWTVDRSVLAANPGVPLNQPAWAVNGSTARIYYRAQFNGTNSVSSAVLTFSGTGSSAVGVASPIVTGAAPTARSVSAYPSAIERHFSASMPERGAACGGAELR